MTCQKRYSTPRSRREVRPSSRGSRSKGSMPSVRTSTTKHRAWSTSRMSHRTTPTSLRPPCPETRRSPKSCQPTKGRTGILLKRHRLKQSAWARTPAPSPQCLGQQRKCLSRSTTVTESSTKVSMLTVTTPTKLKTSSMNKDAETWLYKGKS